MTLVPSTRLLTATLGVALVACVAGPLPELVPVWLISLGGLLVLALADALVTVLKSAVIESSAPALLRFTKDRPAVIPVTFKHPSAQARRIRFGLALPSSFETPQTDTSVDLPAGAVHARITWACTPRQRGKFTEVLACVEMDSRLKLWRIRTRSALNCELRVYPNLFSERRQMAALFLARGANGAVVRRMIGRGREFEKLRDYAPGDGYDEIHWKATAKRGRPITKVFQAERTQEVYVVMDASRLSARAVTHDGITQTALERQMVATLVLMLAAEQQGDRLGLVVHDDRVRLFLPANRGKAHSAACREALLGLEPSANTADIAEIVRHLKTHVRRRALLFFLTDLTDPVLADDFMKHVSVLSRQHLVLVGQLRSPDVAPLFSGERVKDEAEIYARLAGHARWSEHRALAQRLKPIGVTATMFENASLASQVVNQYLQVKRRQAL